MIEKIHWHGHATFRIEGTQRIYIDPWRILDDSPPADVILISHEHYDHFSPSDIEKLLQPHTRIIAGEGVAPLVKQEFRKVETLRAWQSLNIERINIKAVPAYTFDDYHPPKRGDVGFVISMDYYDLYYAGDTDLIPEMRSIGCDIAILPVSAKEGMMTIDHARQAVEILRPRYVIPSHYGTSEGGTRLDALALQTAIDGLAEMVWLEALVY
ncbi:MAG: Zn-dependent hydrolase [Phototrophicales bacterium]|nr:MAG: Zn-dependent hydrolase [Phototrophicales bacterium]